MLFQSEQHVAPAREKHVKQRQKKICQQKLPVSQSLKMFHQSPAVPPHRSRLLPWSPGASKGKATEQQEQPCDEPGNGSREARQEIQGGASSRGVLHHLRMGQKLGATSVEHQIWGWYIPANLNGYKFQSKMVIDNLCNILAEITSFL